MAGLGGSSGGGSGAVRAGRAFVELFAEDNKVYRALDRLKRRFQQFGGFVARSGSALGAAGLSVLTPLKPALDSINELGQQGQMAQGLGLAAERFTGLAGAFNRFGIDAQGTVDVLSDVSDWVQDAAVNGGELAETFGFMGVNAKALMGLRPDQQFNAIADALSKLDPTLAAGLAARLGGDFQKLLPLLRQGSGAVDDLAGQFSASAADVEKAAEANRAYQGAAGAIGRVWREVVVAVAPAVKEFATEVSGAVGPVIDLVRRNRETIATVVKVAAGVAAAGAAVTGLGLAFSVAGTAIGLAVGAFKLVAGAIGFLLSPIGLVTAAVVALGYLFVTETDAGKRAWVELGELFGRIGATFSETWKGIKDAVNAGDLKLAFEVAGAGIKVAWAELMLSLTKSWNDALDDMVRRFRANPILGKAVVDAFDSTTGFGLARRLFGIDPTAEEVGGALSADLNRLQSDLQKAKDELKRLTDRAEGERKGADLRDLITGAGGAIVGGALAARSYGVPESQKFAGSAGSFSAVAAAQRFGGDRAVQKKLENIVDNTGATVAAVVRLAHGLTFK